MTPSVYDARRCQLGEGPLWHPLRKQLFWFDISGKKLLSQTKKGAVEWEFDAPVSAAGWLDFETLLIASSTGLWQFDLADGSKSLLAPLEQTNAMTRSNDGRADPWGGFWIGTMGIDAQPGAGAVYRYHQGQLRKLFGQITISNAICFAPNRQFAYFTDTAEAKLMQVPLDRAGWPAGNTTVLIDFRPDNMNPDGAIVDAQGALWIALWGAGRVASYSADGVFQHSIEVPAAHTTCPAFGGEEMTTLFVTSAMQGIDSKEIQENTSHGQTFAIANAGEGRAEPKVIL